MSASSGNFDLLVLGSSGGPLEGHNSSFILKPSSITFKEILTQNLNQHLLAIDAGAGLGRLTALINDERKGAVNRISHAILEYYNDSITLETANPRNIPSTSLLGLSSLPGSPIETAYKFWELVKTQLISHPHMDHIASLAINSPAFGFESGKVVYGLKDTIDALKSHIFNDSVWPELTSSINGEFLTLHELLHAKETQLSDVYKVTAFQLNHGCLTQSMKLYHSSVHLIEYQSKQILIFGDVESDLDSSSNERHNLVVWKYVSKYIVDRTLRTIVIECSTPNQPSNVPLYGHLNPNALIYELQALSGMIKTQLSVTDDRYNQPLKGLDILITHVKDRGSSIDPRKIILQELNDLNEKFELGCHFTILLAGQVYTVN